MTSALMSLVRGKNTRPELALRRALWHKGLRYRVHVRTLPGSPDLVFGPYRVAVFVDGDFWHGRILREEGPRRLSASFRSNSRGFWIAKIKRNVQRDAENERALTRLGWRVIRLWGKDVMMDAEKSATSIARLLRRKGRLK